MPHYLLSLSPLPEVIEIDLSRKIGAEKAVNEAYYDIKSPHYKDNERYSWAVKTLAEGWKEELASAKTRYPISGPIPTSWKDGMDVTGLVRLQHQYRPKDDTEWWQCDPESEFWEHLPERLADKRMVAIPIPIIEDSPYCCKIKLKFNTDGWAICSNCNVAYGPEVGDSKEEKSFMQAYGEHKGFVEKKETEDELWENVWDLARDRQLHDFQKKMKERYSIQRKQL